MYCFQSFFFNDTATTEIYTLSLHDALPISKPERRLVLLDCLRHAARLEVGLAQRRVLVGELRGHVSREPLPGLAAYLRRPPERRVRLRFPPQLVEDDRPVDERLHVVRVQRQSAIELRQGLLPLPHQRVGEAEQVVRVGERTPGRDHFLEEVDRPVVVLQLKPFAGLLDEMLRTDVHGSPRTSGRTAGSPPRCRPWGGTRARARRDAGPPR